MTSPAEPAFPPPDAPPADRADQLRRRGSADLLDPARVNVFERWASRAALTAFRGDGPSEGQLDAIRGFAIEEFDAKDILPTTTPGQS